MVSTENVTASRIFIAARGIAARCGRLRRNGYETLRDAVWCFVDAAVARKDWEYGLDVCFLNSSEGVGRMRDGDDVVRYELRYEYHAEDVSGEAPEGLV